MSAVYSQNIKEINPTLGYLVDKSPEGEIDFIRLQQECERLFERISDESDIEKLTKEEKEFYENCLIDKEGYWDVIGMGCSWYCGGGQDTLSATSELKSYKGINYSASNAHDLDYKTAWVEGVKRYGIGEALTYHFPPENPRITKIIIVNGYVKSEDIWRNNSRVKKLKMYLNDEQFAILNLVDTREEQHFSFEPIGNSDRDNWDELKNKPWWTMRFEIVEVYEGDKYDDTAITEIYFDGIDVH